MDNGPSLEIVNFSGGMTDNFIGRTQEFSQLLKNFTLTVDDKPTVRMGSSLDGTNDSTGKATVGTEILLRPIADVDRPIRLGTSTTSSSEFGKVFYFDGGALSELTGPTSNHLFTTAHGTASDHRFTHTRWNGHIYVNSTAFNQKVNFIVKNSSAVHKLYTLGLPKPSDTITGLTAVAGHTYIYYFGYKHSYTSGVRTFVVRGTALRKTHIQANAIDGAHAVSIANIPNIANSTSDNYDTSNLVIEIYRTIDTGTVPFLVGTISNATTTFSDTCTDAQAQAGTSPNAFVTGTATDNGIQHYTVGGVVDFDAPPACKFIHTSERGLTYYGYVKSGSDELQNRVQQSVIGQPWAAPGSFFDDADDEITGISSYRGVPIIGCRNSVYRGDGVFDNFGNGQFVLQRIADNVGVAGHNSMVQTYYGVFFCGERGFYWTDGNTVQKISVEIDASFLTYLSSATTRQNVVGCYDEVNQTILWTFPETSDSDGIFVLHLRYGIRLNSAFTTFGGATSTSNPFATVYPSTVPDSVVKNFQAKCLCYYNGDVYRGDNRGYAFKFDSTKNTDPRVVTSVNSSTWGTTYVHYDWKSAAFNFGSETVRKWTPQVILTLKNRGNVSVQPQADRDARNLFQPMKEIKHLSSFTWAADGVLWGDPVIYASERQTYSDIRWLKSPSIRCNYRQIELTNAFTVIQKSDNMGLATIDPVAKTVTIMTGSWPSDVLDYYISLASDSYVAHYLVTARTSTVLTVSDALNLMPAAGNYKWVLRGYAKGQVTQIQSAVLPFSLLTSSQTPFRTGDTGENA